MFAQAKSMCAGDETARPHVGRCKLPACCIDCDNHPQPTPLTYSPCMYLANLSIISSHKLVASPVVTLLISGSTTFRPFLAYGVSHDIRAPICSLRSQYKCHIHLILQNHPGVLHELLLLIHLCGINLADRAAHYEPIPTHPTLSDLRGRPPAQVGRRSVARALSTPYNRLLHLPTTTSNQVVFGIHFDRRGNYKCSDSVYVEGRTPV